MKCDHTLYHADELGQFLGSWVTERVGSRTKIVCGGCGKFYAYLPDKVRRKPIRGRFPKESDSQALQS